jgi:hypothetical protein
MQLKKKITSSGSPNNDATWVVKKGRTDQYCGPHTRMKVGKVTTE